MAQKKASEVDRFLAHPEPSYRTLLIYGPDRGLVAERALKFAKSINIDLNDPFTVVTLEADNVAEDPLRLVDEANTIAMFGGARLIWIKGSTRKNLAKAFQPVLQSPPKDAWILIEAGNLKKSSALRAIVEKSKSGMALPCYQDEALAIDRLIDEVMTSSGLQIEENAKELLKSRLGGDRLASRAELDKLVLFAMNQELITSDDVSAIVGDASSTLLDELLDTVSIGDITSMQKYLVRILSAGTTTTTVLIALTRHFQTLHRCRSAMDKNRLSAQSVVGGLRPMISFKRKTTFTRSLQAWSRASLDKILNRLDSVSLDARASPTLSRSLTTMTLLAIAIEGRSRLNRR